MTGKSVSRYTSSGKPSAGLSCCRTVRADSGSVLSTVNVDDFGVLRVRGDLDYLALERLTAGADV